MHNMDTQYTSGPWVRCRNIDNPPDIHVLAEDGALIATVSAMVSYNPVARDSDEMKANAHLTNFTIFLQKELKKILTALKFSP